MTEAPTRFYLRRIGAMALMGSVLTNLAILAAMFTALAMLAPTDPTETIAMTISN